MASSKIIPEPPKHFFNESNNSELILDSGPSPLLGSGSFGRVYKYWDKASSEPRAVKQIQIANTFRQFAPNLLAKTQPASKVVQKLLRECKIPLESGLNDCKFIVKIYSAWAEGPDVSKILNEQKLSIIELIHKLKDGSSSVLPKNFLYVQMELCDRLSLRDWLRENGTAEKRMKKERILEIQRHLSSGLEYMHGKGVIHRDLKPGNIFSSLEGKEGKGKTWKIGDFGLSIKLDAMEKSDPTFGGTDLYRSPEMFEEKGYNAKTDVYSLGLIFLEMFVPDYLDEDKKIRDFQSIRDRALKSSQVKVLVPEVFPTSGTLISCMVRNSVEQRLDSVDVYNIVVNDFPIPEESEVEKVEKIYEIELPYSFGLQEPFPIFPGRDSEIASLETQRTQKRSHLAVIKGLGGIGKTELAKQFAVNIFENKNISCIWIQGASVQSVQADIYSVASDLNILIEDVHKKKKSIRSLLKEIQYKLRKSPLVLIIDNYDEEDNEAANEVLVTCKSHLQTPKPFCIVTTKNQRLLRGAGSTIKLDVLSESACISLVTETLASSVGGEFDESFSEKNRELCELVQYFPLALQQAVSFIKEEIVQEKINTPSSASKAIDKYNALYHQNKKLALNFNLNNLDHDYKETTFTTWNISMAAIKKVKGVGAIADKLMTFITLWAEDGDGAEASFLTKEAYARIQQMENTQDWKSLETKEDDVGQAISLLVKYSMAQKNRRRSYRELVTFINVHGLVQQVIRISLMENMMEERLISQYFQYMKSDHLYFTSRSMSDLAYDREWGLWISKLWALSASTYPEFCKASLGVLYDLWRKRLLRNDKKFLTESLAWLEDNVGKDQEITLAVRSQLVTYNLEKGDFSESENLKMWEAFIDCYNESKASLGLKNPVITNLIKWMTSDMFTPFKKEGKVREFLQTHLFDLLELYCTVSSNFRSDFISNPNSSFKPILDTSLLLVEIVQGYVDEGKCEELCSFCEKFLEFATRPVAISGFRRNRLLFSLTQLLADRIELEIKFWPESHLSEIYTALQKFCRYEKTAAYLELRVLSELEDNPKYNNLLLPLIVSMTKLSFDFNLLKKMTLRDERLNKKSELKEKMWNALSSLDSLDEANKFSAKIILNKEEIASNESNFFRKLINVTRTVLYWEDEAQVKKLLKDPFKSPEFANKKDQLDWTFLGKYEWTIRAQKDSFLNVTTILELMKKANEVQVFKLLGELLILLMEKNYSCVSKTEIFWGIKEILTYLWRRKDYNNFFEWLDLFSKFANDSLPFEYLKQALNSVAKETCWTLNTSTDPETETINLNIAVNLILKMLAFGLCDQELISVLIDKIKAHHLEKSCEAAEFGSTKTDQRLTNEELILTLGKSLAKCIQQRNPVFPQVCKSFNKVCSYIYKWGKRTDHFSICKLALGLNLEMGLEQVLEYAISNLQQVPSAIGFRLYLELGDFKEFERLFFKPYHKILNVALKNLEKEEEDFSEYLEVIFFQEIVGKSPLLVKPPLYGWALIEIARFRQRKKVEIESLLKNATNFFGTDYRAMRRVCELFLSREVKVVDKLNNFEVILFVQILMLEKVARMDIFLQQLAS